MRTHRRYLILFALSGCFQADIAQGADESAPAPTSINLGVGVTRSADYEGGRSQSLNVFPVANVTYKTDVGIFMLGGDASAPSNNIPLASWTIANPSHYAAGLTVDFDGGRRDDRRGTALRSGSPRLRGLGNLAGTLEYGVFGSYTVGVATPNLAVRTAPSSQGHGGTIVDLSVDLALPVKQRLTLTASPTVTWVSDRYMRRYFGVTPAQSAASGFRTYRPDGGVKSYGVAITANFQVTKHWIVVGNLVGSRLRGEAGASPIVERRNSVSPSLGVAYSW